MRVSAIHLIAFTFVSVLAAMAVISSALWWGIKTILLLTVAIVYLRDLFTVILNPTPLPAEFVLLRYYQTRFWLLLRIQDPHSLPKKNILLWRDQFSLSQWRQLCKKVRFYSAKK